MNFQMTPGLLTFPPLPLPLKHKPFPGRVPAFLSLRVKIHITEIRQLNQGSFQPLLGHRQCWKGHSSHFIPNQVTSHEILEPSPGSALDAQVKLAAILAHQMGHRKSGGDSPRANG